VPAAPAVVDPAAVTNRGSGFRVLGSEFKVRFGEPEPKTLNPELLNPELLNPEP
jgi:hypothetical protein